VPINQSLRYKDVLPASLCLIATFGEDSQFRLGSHEFVVIFATSPASSLSLTTLVSAMAFQLSVRPGGGKPLEQGY